MRIKTQVAASLLALFAATDSAPQALLPEKKPEPAPAGVRVKSSTSYGFCTSDFHAVVMEAKSATDVLVKPNVIGSVTHVDLSILKSIPLLPPYNALAVQLSSHDSSQINTLGQADIQKFKDSWREYVELQSKNVANRGISLTQSEMTVNLEVSPEKSAECHKRFGPTII